MTGSHPEPLSSALGCRAEIARRLTGKRLAVFLDYDGTLTPIVARPELALLSKEMRETVRRLGECCTVAVVSGRARSDVHQRVGIEGIYYAGNHGLEIEGPRHSMIKHEQGMEFLEAVDAVFRRIQPRTKNIDGVLIEHKKYSLSVHYRLADPARVPEIEAVVDEALQHYPNLRKHHGKKVFEVRPRIDWDKGKAVLWLLQALNLGGDDVVPIYVGDDVTDEDAFRALQETGIGVLVTDRPRQSAADYVLHDTADVKRFLDMLVQQMEEAAA